MCKVGKTGLEKESDLLGETEVKAYVTEKMTFAWKWPECSLRSGIMYFQLCVSRSLAKCPGCNKCSMDVGWVDGDWLAGWASVSKEHWKGWPPQTESTEAGNGVVGSSAVGLWVCHGEVGCMGVYTGVLHHIHGLVYSITYHSYMDHIVC